MSLYSVPQPLTRESTAYESEQVLTPTDIIPGQRFKGGAIGTGAPLIRRERSVLPSSDGYSFVDRLNAIREDGHYDPEPYGPYFSLPVDPAACTTLSRRTTTKDLISRYESLESTSSTRQEPPNAMAKKVKGRSPIRQSFRNLLSALGKRAKGMGKDHSASAASRSTVSICLDSPPLPSSANTRGIHLDIPSTNTSKSSSSGMPACITPTALHTGPLLYLCNPIAVGGLPIWVDCTAILHSSHIVVTWFTSHDNPSTTMITLPQCTDVRSLALADLDLDEKSMLPTRPNVGELKVFELLFEGRGREKFAAFSVTGRAGWGRRASLSRPQEFHF
ncbi:hypothetical protein BXZ70DRAFT_9414 [Cristinia sonorae]|uniref:Uncharacterized protein n=1 Tax=Cristinia sonorae TaxID=1940300 RepID=A0A8K0UY14_9AGAR|nr:hypothetical protein BXZ70DRAFT_9414 [Cristinia sonorae]